MKKRIFVLITFLCLLFGNVSFQATAATEKVSDDLTYIDYVVQISPEDAEAPEGFPEDTPNVLCLSAGRLKNIGETEFTGEITIGLPENMKDFSINVVGDYQQGESSVINEIKDYKLDEKNHTLTWKPNYTIKKDEVYSYLVEFFYNPIQVKEGGNKSFSATIAPERPVETMKVLIDQPAGGDAFKIDATGETTTLTQIGTLRYIYTFENVKANEEKTFNVTYTKKDNKSSREKINDGEWNIPQDETHGMFASDEPSSTEIKPLISTFGAILIALSICLAAVLIIVTILYKRKKNTAESVEEKSDRLSNQKKASQSAVEEEKKKLRIQLINGEIDQEAYDREINQLL